MRSTPEPGSTVAKCETALAQTQLFGLLQSSRRSVDGLCFDDPQDIKESVGRSSPVLESRLRASSAYPWKGPVGCALGAIRDILAPGIGSDRADGLPDNVECPRRIDLADHGRLGQVMI